MDNMAERKRPTNLTISESIVTRLSEIAAEERRTLSNLVDKVLAEWLLKRGGK